MAGIGSKIRTVLSRLSPFRRKEILGQDEAGNVYFRWFEQLPDGTSWERRQVDTPGGEYNPSSIPPEWSQWLRKTRVEAPTAEDLERGKAHRERIKQLATAHAEEDARQAQRAKAGEKPMHEPEFIAQLTEGAKKEGGQ